MADSAAYGRGLPTSRLEGRRYRGDDNERARVLRAVAAALDAERLELSIDGRCFRVGDRAQRRDHSAYTSSPAWGVGYVTQLEPQVLVTIEDEDPSDENTTYPYGYTWDEVRPLPAARMHRSSPAPPWGRLAGG